MKQRLKRCSSKRNKENENTGTRNIRQLSLYLCEVKKRDRVKSRISVFIRSIWINIIYIEMK